MNRTFQNYLNILLVEDDSGDAALVADAFNEIEHLRFEISHVDRLEKALHVLENQNFHVVLLDLGLPDAQGLDTVSRMYAAAPNVPIIALTGLDDDMTAMKAIKEGVQDYLVKGQMQGQMLARAISYAIERKSGEEAILKALKEKEILLKEIHHRVKNNLQIISSLFSLQSEYIKDKDTLELYQTSQNRIKSMLLVHELLYHSSNPTKINFAEFLRKLTVNLFRGFGVNSETLKLTIDVEEILFEADTAIACGLVVNEILSNALKHAFPNKRTGEILIKLTCDNQLKRYTMIIRDSGVGLPKDVDFHKSSSFGLQLIQTLVSHELDGTVQIKNTEGTQYTLSFCEIK